MDAVRCLLLSFVFTCYVSCMEVNVALKKKTSTTSGELNNWKTSGAVDGDHVKLTSPSSCFHSDPNGAPADWTVDLGQEYQLYSIIVYLRTWFYGRTANSRIYVDNDQSRVCYTFPSTISINPTQLTCNETARYVTIMNPGNEGQHDTLNICEVEIFACAPKYRGLNCTISCNCDDCDRWAGVCYSPCRPGWEGERCDRACNGRYGFNCTNSCTARHCSNSSSSCDPVSGTCDSGCLPGYTGHDCTTECSSSMYGLSCTKNCMDRHCIGNSTCDHVTGSCDQGCEPGRKSLDCTEECTEGEEFGPNCSGSCNARHCLNQSTCHPANGLCENGCETGWEGPQCLQAVSCNGKYGSNCANSCAARHCSDSSSSCDPVSGTCDSGCLAGYNGHDCTSECPSSMYGLGCTENCMDRHCIGNSTCNHVTGSCDQGCEPGWKSIDCTEGIDADVACACESISPDARIIALSTAVGVLVVIIIILSVLLARSKFKKQSSDKSAYATNRSTPDASSTPDYINTDITSSNNTSSTAHSTYETLQLTEDNHYTGLSGRKLYENA